MTTPPPTSGFPPGTWTITPETTVTLTVKKLKLITVAATVRVIDGSVTVAADGTATAVTASIDAASFASGNAKRDAHVAGDDFLDSESYPLITFEASEIDARAMPAAVTGTAMVKGRAAPLTLTVTDITVGERDATLHATAVVDRNVLGVDTFPNIVIGADVAIAIHAHLAAG